MVGGDGFSCGSSINFLGDLHVRDGGLIGVAGVMGVEDWRLGWLGDGLTGRAGVMGVEDWKLG